MRPLLMVAACAAVFAASANAAAISATFNGLATGTTGTVERLISDSTTGTRAWTEVQTGLFSFTRTGGDYTGSFQPGNSFYAFCIEPQQFAGDATFNVDPLALGVTNIGGMGATRAGQIDRLLSTYYPNFGAPITSLQTAAIQIAIWEIVRENSGTLNVSSGTTQFRNPSNGQALALAQTYLNAVSTAGGSNSGRFLALNSFTNQDMVVRVNDIPEPGTMLLLSAALPVAFLMRRKRK